MVGLLGSRAVSVSPPC